jgi:hypothetical protein
MLPTYMVTGRVTTCTATLFYPRKHSVSLQLYLDVGISHTLLLRGIGIFSWRIYLYFNAVKMCWPNGSILPTKTFNIMTALLKHRNFANIPVAMYRQLSTADLPIV